MEEKRVLDLNEIEVLQLSVVCRPKHGEQKASKEMMQHMGIGEYPDIGVTFMMKPNPVMGFELHVVAQQPNQNIVMPQEKVKGFGRVEAVKALKRVFGVMHEEIKDDEHEEKMKKAIEEMEKQSET
jgi:hypothetical protein